MLSSLISYEITSRKIQSSRNVGIDAGGRFKIPDALLFRLGHNIINLKDY